MDEDETAASLRDELALEIERALAIDPGPRLKAQVRARIDLERARRSWWLRWPPVSIGAAAIAVVALIMLVMPNPHRATEPTLHARRTADIASIVSPAAPATPGRTRANEARSIEPAARLRHGRAPVRPAEPEVLVPAGEAALLRRLAADVRDGRIDPSVLDNARPGAAPLDPLREITIQPIAIGAIARLQPLEGDRQ